MVYEVKILNLILLIKQSGIILFYFKTSLSCKKSGNESMKHKKEGNVSKVKDSQEWKMSMETLRDLGFSPSMEEIHSDDEERESEPLINKSYMDMTPVTIFRSNQLGISINVESPQETHQTQSCIKAPSSWKNYNHCGQTPFECLVSKTPMVLKNLDAEKGIETKENKPRIANKQKFERDPRSRLNAVYPWEHSYTNNKQKQIKSRIYMFLEHPSGWICFTYHMCV